MIDSTQYPPYTPRSLLYRQSGRNYYFEGLGRGAPPIFWPRT